MKTNHAKRLLSVILLVLMVASLSACGSGTAPADSGTSAGTSSGTSSAAAAGSTGGTISISTYAPTDAMLENMGKYYSEPISKGTGVKVEYKIYANRESLIVEVAGGGGPDILDLDGPTDVVEFAKSGKALDLTKYAEQYKWADLFMDWAYTACYYDNILYSLPTCYEGMGMYYNMDVMQKNGWVIPKSLDELESLFKTIKTAGLVPVSFGNANYQGAVDWLYSTMLSCYGGVDNLTAVLTGKDTLQGNQGVSSSMQKLVDWWKAGYIDNNSQSVTTDDMITRFANGDAVMMIDGTWGSSNLTADYPSCKWKFDLMPPAKAGEAAIFPIAIGGCDVISANCKDPDTAAKVLNYIYTSNQDNHYASIVNAGMQPYPVKWFETSKLAGMDQKLVDLYSTLDTAMDNKNVGFCSWTFYPAQSRVYMNENTDSCFLGKLTVKDYLTNAQAFIDEAIKNGTAPVLPNLK